MAEAARQVIERIDAGTDGAEALAGALSAPDEPETE